MRRSAQVRDRGRGRSRVSLVIGLLVALVGLGSLAVVADQWRRSDAGVTVVVRGTQVVREDAVVAAAAVADSSVLADVDLMAVQRRIEKLPYVRSVVVRRDPPRTLVVEITEREPVALLVGDGAGEYMVDADGIVLPCVQSTIEYDLPVISGVPLRRLKAGLPARDARVIGAVDVLRTADSLGAGYGELFSELNVSRPRDLVLYTHDAGVPVLFGRSERAAQKLLSFRTFWETVAVHEDLRDIAYVDVRFRDQVVVRHRFAADTLAVAPKDTILITSD
jgi:cell division protein FtsQ